MVLLEVILGRALNLANGNQLRQLTSSITLDHKLLSRSQRIAI